MSDVSHAERRARGLESLKKLRGTDDIAKTAQQLEDANGALGSFVIDFALGDIWSRPGISRRDRSLIVISILASLNQLTQLKSHVQGAINHGMTPEEVREVMIHLCGYAGFPRALDAMRVTNESLAEMGHAPKDGKLPPSAKQSQAERRKAGIEGIEKVSGNMFMEATENAVASAEKRLGALAQYAFDFVYGDIWARPQLSRRDRSLLVLGSLGALGREHELEIHIPGAFRHGVTRVEIDEFIVTLATYAGFPFAVDATYVLMAHLAASK